MTVSFQNEFMVSASPERVWAVLTDPALAVPCMPGAQVTEVIGEHGFKGIVSLRVGPVQLQFKGEGQLANLDVVQKTGSLTAKGSDGKGRGNFSADMRFQLANAAGETQVRVTTDLVLSGMVAQYGRGSGVVKQIASQLTDQFAKRLGERVLSATQEIAPAQAGSAGQPSDLPISSEAVSGDVGHDPRGTQDSINVLGLLWSTGWSALKHFLSRLFGTSRKS